MNTIIIIASVLLNCMAQIFIKKGMLLIGEVSFQNFLSLLIPMLCNLWLWSAMVCYAASVILWIVVLSKVEVSFAYPLLSIGYVVVALVGWRFFGESLSAIRFVGIVIICIGVYLISKS